MMLKQRVLFCFVLLFVFCWIEIIIKFNWEEVDVVGWNINTTRNVSFYVSKDKPTPLLPKTFCKTENLLIVMVCSSPKNFEPRSAIRNTWGYQQRYVNGTMAKYFLLGQTNNQSLQDEIYAESKEYGDIIQESFIDTYNNLTLKTLNVLKLVSTYCPNKVKFVLKVDDDVFVNMERLISMLNDRKNKTNLIIGHKMCKSGAIRNPSNKWYSSRYMFEERVYPDYVSGTAYVMSIDLTEKLFDTALSTPIFHLEDVYITGICAKKANAEIEGHRFFFYFIKGIEECLINIAYTFHDYKPSDLYKIYSKLNDGNITKRCEHYKEHVEQLDCDKRKGKS